MDMHGAKLKSLKNLMAMMDDHMTKPFAKGKAKPAVAEIDVESSDKSDPNFVHGDEKSASDGDHDDLKSLMDMYGKDPAEGEGEGQAGAHAPISGKSDDGDEDDRKKLSGGLLHKLAGLKGK